MAQRVKGSVLLALQLDTPAATRRSQQRAAAFAWEHARRSGSSGPHLVCLGAAARLRVVRFLVAATLIVRAGVSGT
jgi:hypothetical protein